jgi:hypothetical protein
MEIAVDGGGETRAVGFGERREGMEGGEGFAEVVEVSYGKSAPLSSTERGGGRGDELCTRVAPLPSPLRGGRGGRRI